ncbi:MAG TPA: hypothetical protein DIW31_11750 [Bacteroidales bacterium]|nr:hypothetical protein [Bacteroidales bacterium]
MGVYPAASGNPAIARWSVPDPLAELTPHESPYLYCAANPVNFIDPSGCSAMTDKLGDRKGSAWYRGQFYTYNSSVGDWVTLTYMGYEVYNSTISFGSGMGYEYNEVSDTYVDRATGKVVSFDLVYSFLQDLFLDKKETEEFFKDYQEKLEEDYIFAGYASKNADGKSISHNGNNFLVYQNLNANGPHYLLIPNIFNSQSMGSEYGLVVSVANGAAAAGPIGAMFDIGLVKDSYGNASLYFTIGGVAGIGASSGLGASKTSKKTTLTNFSGASQGIMWTFFGAGVEAYGNTSDDKKSTGDKYVGAGINIGVGAIYGYYYSYTFLFTVPSSDFWCRPGRHF